MEEELKKQTKEKVEEQIKLIIQDGLEQEKPMNLERLYKLIDIHKDMENEVYWKEKIMRYRESYNEGSYGRRGVPGTGRGRYSGIGAMSGYSESMGNYGRRGVPGTGRYRGEEGEAIMGDMYEGYGAYSEGKEAYSRGNYGAKEDSMKALKYMLGAMEDFGMYLIEDADTEEEKNMIRQTMRKMSEK